MWGRFWTVFCFIYLFSILAPTSPCPNYYSVICSHKSSSSDLQNCLGYLRSFIFPLMFYNMLVNFHPSKNHTQKNRFWLGFNWSIRISDSYTFIQHCFRGSSLGNGSRKTSKRWQDWKRNCHYSQSIWLHSMKTPKNL